MEIVLIMSQEHETLPKAEIKAVLTAERVPFILKYHYGGVMILDVPEEFSDHLKDVGKRFSYTHEVCRLLI